MTQDRPHEDEMSRIRFLHAVGKSTLRQGFTVPVSVHASWVKRIKKGEKVPVTISFGSAESVDACLRRINNTVGHLQFRYESKKQATLRDFLKKEFSAAPAKDAGLLEVVEVGHHSFLFRPIPGDHGRSPTLSIYKPLFHNFSAPDARAIPEFQELERSLSGIEYCARHGQREYNRQIAHVLVAAGWNREVRVLSQIGFRTDFERNGVWLEIEFGNARTYYQDYIKFTLAHRYRSAECGILLCPTEPLAHLLCDLGQRRALAKRKAASHKPPSYSGMMTYEKAVRELPYLGFVLTGRIIVAGIHFARDDRHT